MKDAPRRTVLIGSLLLLCTFSSAQSIRISRDVVPTGQVPDGFTLTWQTDRPGSTEAYYGPTPGLGLHAFHQARGTTHELQLTGMAPASFHYVQPFSVAGGDTAFAPVEIYSTASRSAGDIKVYFTKGVDTSVSSGEDAIGLFSAIDDTIKAYIDRAQQTLDIAMYNTNSTLMVQAVNAAKARGVQVRWIAEGGNSNYALGSLDSGIPVLYRENSEGSGMHNKFMVIDADDADRAVVMGGSCNWTTQSFFDDYNNIVFIHDQAVAQCYRAEFQEMWGGSGPQPDPVQSRFGADKTNNTPHTFNVGGTTVEVYFSPSDGTTSKIRNAINAASANLYFALLIFTENSLGTAVRNANNRPGMTVRGDIEDINATGSEFNFLVNNGVEIYSHEDEDGMLHHKYAILDEGGGSPKVVTGSHNWTASAENVNDENILIIHDGTVANQFFQEWSARHNAVAGIGESAVANGLSAWPVPAHDELFLLPTGTGPALITVHDATGREVYRMETNGLATIRTGDWQAGMYVVSSVQDGMRSHRTVVVW